MKFKLINSINHKVYMYKKFIRFILYILLIIIINIIKCSNDYEINNIKFFFYINKAYFNFIKF